jgi:hypothetical protein
MELLHPGVYIQEIPSGVRPIEGASTSNAAFMGKAEMGPVGRAQLITSAAEFESRYGGFLSDSYLAHAVFHFFNNGGKKTYVVRITGSGTATVAISIKDRKNDPAETLTIKAANEGAWGNKLDVVITNSREDPDNEFTLQVLRDNVTPSLPPLLLETHENLSMNRDSVNFVEKVVAANSRYLVVEATKTNQSTAPEGTSQSGRLPVGNGAGELRLGRKNGGEEEAGGPGTGGTSRSGVSDSPNPDADKRKFMISLDGEDAQEITVPPTASTGDEIAAAIRSAVSTLRATDKSKQAAYDDFTCIFTDGRYLLTSGTKGTNSSVVVTGLDTRVRLPAGTHRFVILINGDGPHEVKIQGALDDGAAIAGAIESAVQSINPKRAVNKEAFEKFECTYKNSGDEANDDANPSLLLKSGEKGLSSSVQIWNATNENVAGLLKLGLTNGGRETNGSAVLRPANSATPDTEYHLGDALVIGNVSGVVSAGRAALSARIVGTKAGPQRSHFQRTATVVARPRTGGLHYTRSQ